MFSTIGENLKKNGKSQDVIYKIQQTAKRLINDRFELGI